MKKQKGPGDYLTISFSQFINESKILSKEEAPDKEEENIRDVDTDSEIPDDTDDRQSVKKNKKSIEPDLKKNNYEEMKEKLEEFDRILNSAPDINLYKHARL